MQLLYRINRTGTTVIVATHDDAMVDRMRRRVIEVRQGRVIRDEVDAGYERERGDDEEPGSLFDDAFRA
jgi:cell division transport system ATP-binding protein